MIILNESKLNETIEYNGNYYYMRKGKYYKAKIGTYPLNADNGISVSKEDYEKAKQYSKK